MSAGRPREFDEGEVLDTALQLFWRQGFEATSKRDLMEATGVASQSLYNAFGDKRALYLAALEHYAERTHGELARALEGPDPYARLVDHVRSLGGRGCAGNRNGCFLCNSGAEFGRDDDEVTAIVGRAMTRRARLFADALSAAQEAGDLPAAADVDVLASTLVASVDGIALLRRSGAPRRLVDGAVEGLLGLLAAAR